MRILHVPTVVWRPEEGISRAVIETAAELDDIEHHLVAARPIGGSFAVRHLAPGWPPATIARARFDAIVRRVQPDVVHLHGGILAPPLAFLPSLRDVPVVASVYSNVRIPGPSRWTRTLLRESLASEVRPLRAVVSSIAGVRATRAALRSGRVAAVCTPNASVLASLSGAGPVIEARGAARLGVLRARASSAPVIAFAGRAEPGRGVEDLVHAFHRVRLTIPNARLRLFLLPGPALEQWQRAFGATPGVEIRAGVSDHLSAQLAECQLVALPFRWDLTITPALVAAEAMSVGVPVVASDVDCLRAIVEPGHNGMLARPSHPDELADAMTWVLSDRARWTACAAAAAGTIAERWSWAGASRAVRSAYDVALASDARYDLAGDGVA